MILIKILTTKPTITAIRNLLRLLDSVFLSVLVCKINKQNTIRVTTNPIISNAINSISPFVYAYFSVNLISIEIKHYRGIEPLFTECNS